MLPTNLDKRTALQEVLCSQSRQQIDLVGFVWWVLLDPKPFLTHLVGRIILPFMALSLLMDLGHSS